MRSMGLVDFPYAEIIKLFKPKKYYYIPFNTPQLHGAARR